MLRFSLQGYFLILIKMNNRSISHSTSNPPNDRQLLHWMLEEATGSPKRGLAWQLFNNRYEDYIWQLCEDVYRSPQSSPRKYKTRKRKKYSGKTAKLFTKVILAIDEHPDTILKAIHRLKDPLKIALKIKAAIGQIVKEQHKKKEHLRYNYVEKRSEMDAFVSYETQTVNSSFQVKKDKNDPIESFSNEDTEELYVRPITYEGHKLDPQEQNTRIEAYVATLGRDDQKLFSLMQLAYKGRNYKDEDGVKIACRELRIKADTYYKRKSRLINKIRNHLTKDLLK